MQKFAHIVQGLFSPHTNLVPVLIASGAAGVVLVRQQVGRASQMVCGVRRALLGRLLVAWWGGDVAGYCAGGVVCAAGGALAPFSLPGSLSGGRAVAGGVCAAWAGRDVAGLGGVGIAGVLWGAGLGGTAW